VRKERRARIEIIPMIDVMMFLLVFFVLISTNVLPALGLKISPPTSSQSDKIVDRTRILVGIDREGHTSINGQPVELSDLPQQIRAATAEKPAAVVVTGDEAAPLQNLVNVMDALKIAGVLSMQFVTRPK
jgi:biopolymer transport protein ExbD